MRRQIINVAHKMNEMMGLNTRTRTLIDSCFAGAVKKIKLK